MQPFAVRLAAVSAVVAIGVGPLAWLQPEAERPEATADMDPEPAEHPAAPQQTGCGRAQGDAAVQGDAPTADGDAPGPGVAAALCTAGLTADAVQNERPIVMLTP